jgi:hypothetical protein
VRDVAVVFATARPPEESAENVMTPPRVATLPEKLPDTSRATIASEVLADVAVVAELDTFNAVAMVASLVSAMAAEGSTSALMMRDEVNAPLPAALWRMPAVVNCAIFIPVNPPPLLPSVIDEAVVVPMASVPATILSSELRATPEDDTVMAVVAPLLPTAKFMASPEAAALLVDCKVSVDPGFTPPISFGAVITPEAKSPEASLATIADAVAEAVAVVALLSTLPAVNMVASLVSAMLAPTATSAFTIKDVVRTPAAELWTMPIEFRAGKVIGAPTCPRIREVVVPPPMVRTPVESMAAVVMLLRVIVPAEKLPEASRAMIVLATLRGVAVVAELDTLPAVAMVSSFVSAMAAAASTSALTIREEESNPPAAL